MLPKLIGSVAPGASEIEHATTRVQGLQNSDLTGDIQCGPGKICAFEQTQFITSRKHNLRGISGKFLLIVGVMFMGRVHRPTKPQMARLALEDFHDHFFSSHALYNAGGSAIGADSRLAMPAMVKNAPDVTNFGPNVEKSLF
jgi:hypothetical protein